MIFLKHGLLQSVFLFINVSILFAFCFILEHGGTETQRHGEKKLASYFFVFVHKCFLFLFSVLFWNTEAQRHRGTEKKKLASCFFVFAHKCFLFLAFCFILKHRGTETQRHGEKLKTRYSASYLRVSVPPCLCVPAFKVFQYLYIIILLIPSFINGTLKFNIYPSLLLLSFRQLNTWASQTG